MERCFITNSKIIEFYEKHTELDFETINLFMIDMLEKLLNFTTPDSNALLDILQTQSADIQKIATSVLECKNDVVNINLKINNIGHEYINNVKSLLNTNNLETKSDLRTAFERETENMLAKTKNIINDTIPVSSELIVNKFKQNLADILNSDNKDVVLTNLINKHEDLSLTIQALVTQANASNETLNNLHTKFNIYTDKLKGSTNKGKLGEQKLEIILNNIFPSDDVKNCTSVPHSGDFLVNRGDKPNIIFETKDYTTNVPQEEVVKFLKDIENVKCNGIFISQQSGITSKPHFWVEVHKGCVLVYLHNVNYDKEVLKVATTVIDMVYNHLPQDGDKNNDITLQELTSVYNEYKLFQNTKDELQKNIEQSKKEQIAQLKKLELPHLQAIFTSHFAQPDNTIFTCEKCGKIFKSSKGLANHNRTCNT